MTGKLASGVWRAWGWSGRRVLPLACAVVLAAAAAAPHGATAGRAVKVLPRVGLAPSARGLKVAASCRFEPDFELSRFWANARQEVDRSVLEILGQHQDEVDRGIRYAKLMHGNPLKRQVAITFDDGPHARYTPKLLAILRRNGVKATFFLVGEQAEKYPELVRAEVAAGHCVGNHTYHHVDLTKVPGDYVATEIKACGKVLESITGEAPHYFRPPGGNYNHGVAQAAVALGYKIVLWTDDPGDYASPGAEVIQERLLDHIGNGGIVLIHDGIQQTIDVLPQILGTLRSRGYEFVTVDEMVGKKS